MGVAIVCDRRELFGPARDQGARPTCMAFAASDIHAAVRADWEPLSCEYAYFHALRRDGGHPDDGATPEAMLVTIRDDGQPPESQWPYLSAVPDDLKQWTPPKTTSPIFRRGSAYGTVSLSTIVGQLDSGAPVLLTMRLSDAFYCPDADGIIASDEPPDSNRRHAVVAVGYGFRDKDRLILIRNSWGNSWGIDGHAWVAETYLTRSIDVIVEMKEDLTNVSGNQAKTVLRSSVA